MSQDIVDFSLVGFGHVESTPDHHLCRSRAPTGAVTLRVNGQLHHIAVGRTHARTHVILLIQDLNVHVVNAVTGELLRELILDPERDYQGRNQDQEKNS